MLAAEKERLAVLLQRYAGHLMGAAPHPTWGNDFQISQAIKQQLDAYLAAKRAAE